MMKKMALTVTKRNFCVVSVVVISSILAGLLGEDRARANDAKVHAGSFCRPWFGVYASATDYTNGYIKNNGSQSFVVVTCPILRDNTLNSNGIADVDMYVYNSSSANQVSCTVYSRDYDASTLDWATDATSGSNLQRLDWGSAITSSDPNFGYYYITCELYSYDAIYQYLVDEH